MIFLEILLCAVAGIGLLAFSILISAIICFLFIK